MERSQVFVTGDVFSVRSLDIEICERFPAMKLNDVNVYLLSYYRGFVLQLIRMLVRVS